MTKPTKRCRWCGGVFVPPAGPGRPQEYCRRAHRQRAYEAKVLAQVHSLGEDDILLARGDFETVRDLLYRIETAWDDALQDLSEADSPSEMLEALGGLKGIIQELRRFRIEPRAIGS